ncbi:MAG TPA: CPBP family glutamic-type intramembrane protease [Candidatus Polarisedimenticolaceae bacterium]|nr:CPBP family glutamic-type intramembrane protease [Candidatus Polarisedimenticolaceae bacterium]
MRLRRDIAWFLVLLGFFTAGLLRQFHVATLTSPLLPAAVGSLSFAILVLLVLVGWRERRLGPTGGEGIRLGSLTPLLLMLFMEKWVAHALLPPLLAATVQGRSAAEADARIRALTGLALLLLAFALSFLSSPARATLHRWMRFARWPRALAGTALAFAATFILLYALTRLLGAVPHVDLPYKDARWAWTFFGQGVRALGEEVYFRGLLLAELLRLLPRLGLRSIPSRRWVAVGITALLFGLEHVSFGGGALRLTIFTVALGVLFGLLVLVTENLPYAAGIHALINWVLLGAVPRLIDHAGRPMPPSGSWIGLVLVFAFVLAFLVHGKRRGGVPVS